MNKEELKNVIPHRNSMLLIDEATKTSETTCEGKKYIKGDEYVECTPKAIRMRKTILDHNDRKRANKE